MRLSLPLLLLLGACQTTAPTTETTTSAAPATPPAELRGTRWLLHALDKQPTTPTAGKEVYLQLNTTELQAEGQAGCNRFRGNIELPATGQLRFGPLMATKMACPDLTIETGFMSALNAARTYRISRDTLRLYGEPAGLPLAELHKGQ
ncbi:META domain-containing protein [Hymenobacter swuensis]|uniref:DUF306 domain-containing protein n=1 Tax=Hymenobacter swuensis DY53 TaxID=1227739 RepID=W8EX27_9BACT|nr:META domain-containing protein [Hymenobacter swuensis]AHJ97123.1 hypothetical protein Hsw_1528 [Hymenobacter swuensis DY53]